MNNISIPGDPEFERRLVLAKPQDGKAAEELREYVNHLILYDSLTGALKNEYFMKGLGREVDLSNRHGHPVSFLFIDIDNFKGYNDNLGELQGHKALSMVARLILNSVRSTDLVGRLGGEEFGVALPNTEKFLGYKDFSEDKIRYPDPGNLIIQPIDSAKIVAEKIRKNIEGFFKENIDEYKREITISIGAATCPLEEITLENLYNLANMRKKQAKDQGKNQVVI